VQGQASIPGAGAATVSTRAPEKRHVAVVAHIIDGTTNAQAEGVKITADLHKNVLKAVDQGVAREFACHQVRLATPTSFDLDTLNPLVQSVVSSTLASNPQHAVIFVCAAASVAEHSLVHVSSYVLQQIFSILRSLSAARAPVANSVGISMLDVTKDIAQDCLAVRKSPDQAAASYIAPVVDEASVQPHES
jgi:hypothetical protein